MILRIFTGYTSQVYKKIRKEFARGDWLCTSMSLNAYLGNLERVMLLGDDCWCSLVIINN